VKNNNCHFVFWLLLALFGQAAMLRLILAGKEMGYQHYLTLDEMFQGATLPAAIFIALQAVLVMIAIFTRRKRILEGLNSVFRPWQLIVLGAAIALTSATVSERPVYYAAELATAAFICLVQFGNITLVALSLRDTHLEGFWRGFSRLVLGGSETHSSKRIAPGGLVWLAALWVLVSSATLNLLVYQNHPHIPDEVAYLYQARMLARGQLSLPAPPVREAFSFYLMEIDENRWFPTPPVGWPAALALGTVLGVPWLVNPLLGAANLVLVFLVLGELYDRKLARISVLLLSFSPWFIFMGMNFLTHTFTLTCGLLAVLSIIRARQTGLARWAWAAGLALGVCSLIRPLEALILAGLLGVWALGFGGERLPTRSLAGLVVSTGLVAALVFPYNQQLTGSWKVFPINSYTDEHFGENSNAYGFGPDRGMGWPIDPFRGHGVADGLVNANLNTFQINTELFGWSTGSLWPVYIFLLLKKFQKTDLLMLALSAAIFTAFFFYYFSGGPDFGARYWYLMIVPLVALSARGLIELTTHIALLSEGGALTAARLWLAVACLSMMALVNFFPWRATDKYFHYLEMRPDVRQLAQETPFGHSLILIQGNEQPDYASAAVYNPLDFEADKPLYAWDRSLDVRNKLLKSFPDRNVWILGGPSRTGNGYRILLGPVPANQLLGQSIAIP